MSVGRWWRNLDHSPAFIDAEPARTLGHAVAGVILLVIVAAVLIAVGVG